MAGTFKDDQVVIAWTSFAVDGVGDVIRKGTKLRANHPAVRKAPQFFVPDGTLEAEWPSEFDRAVEESMRTDAQEKAERARHSPPPIPEDRAVEVIEAFRIGFDTYNVGRRFDRDDELVQVHPEYFGTPRRPLV